MKLSRIVLGIVAVAVCWSGVSAHAADPAKKTRVLMLSQSVEFTHGPVKRKGDELSVAEVAITQLGQQSGLFTTTCSQQFTDFNKENLKNYDVVVFYTQSAKPLPIKAEDAKYFSDEWLKQKGHAVVGFHSATDTARNNDPNDKWYRDIMGGTFDGHPWNAGETVTITVHDTKHPATKSLGEEFQIKDEIYQYQNFVPENVHVLMSLNMEKCKTKAARHVPVAWVKTWGEGKLFYTNLGHNDSTWADKRFQQHMEGGIRWALGLEEGDATPNPKVSADHEAKSKAAAAAK